MNRKNLIFLIICLCLIVLGIFSLIYAQVKEKEAEKEALEGELYQNGVEYDFEYDESEWEYIGGDEIPSKGTPIEPKESSGEMDLTYDPGEMKDVKDYEEPEVFEGVGDPGIPTEE